MSDVIEEKVVEMRFDNRNFNKNIDQSIESLDRMDEALKLKNGDEGLRNVNKAAKNLNMEPAIAAVETLKSGFSAMEVVAITAIANITNKVLNLGQTLVNTFAIAPLKSGFNEYSQQLNSTQVIMSNTGDTLQTVTKYLDELNEYADKTIYSFGDMTNAIGKFAAAGVQLEPATEAIKGLSNAAALVGANGTQLYSAYYNLAQSLQVGYLQTIDWNSLANSTIGNKTMREAFVKTAIAMGKFTENSAQAQKAYSDFKGSLADKWLTKDIIIETLNKYSRAIDGVTDSTGKYIEFTETVGYDEYGNPIVRSLEAIKDASGEVTKYVLASGEEIEAWEAELAAKAKAAATEIKSFSQMWDTLTEAAGTGWAETWKLIVGDLETAKKFWTAFEEPIEEVISLFNDARNSMLEMWADPSIYNGRQNLLDGILTLEKGLMRLFKVIYYAWDRVFPALDEKLAVISARFKKFSEAIATSADEAEALEDVLVILLQPLKVLFKVLGFVVKLGATAVLIATTLFKMATYIIATIYNLPELLMCIWEWVRQSEPFKVLTTVLEGLAAILYTIGSILWRLATLTFKMVLVMGELLIELFKALGNAVMEFVYMLSKSEKFMYVVNTAVTILKVGFELLIFVIETAITKLTEFFNSLNFSSFTGLVTSGTTAAKDFIDGIVNGITNSANLSKIKASSIGLANTLLEAFRGPDGIDAHSPSKKGYEYGKYVPEGVSNGMLDGAKYISKAAKQLANESLVPLTDVKRQAGKNSKTIAEAYGKVQSSVYKDGKKTAASYAQGLKDANTDINFGSNIQIASDNVEMQLQNVTANVKDAVDLKDLNASGEEATHSFIDGLSTSLESGKYDPSIKRAGKETADGIIDGYNEEINNSEMTTGNTFVEWVKTTWDTISKFAVHVGASIVEFVSSITPGQIALFAFVGSLVALIASFAMLNHGLSEFIEGLGDILHSLSARIYAEAFDNITSSLLHLAEAIALIAFTATLNPEGIKTAGIILGGFTIALLGLLFALSRIPMGLENLRQYIQGIAALSAGATILLGFAGAVYILARALGTLASIDTENLTRSIIILGGFMLGMALVLAETMYLMADMQFTGLIGIALSLLAFAAAVRILVHALDEVIAISNGIEDIKKLVATIILVVATFGGLIILAGRLATMGRTLAAGLSLLALNLLIVGGSVTAMFLAFSVFGKQMREEDFSDEITTIITRLGLFMVGLAALSAIMILTLGNIQNSGRNLNDITGVFLSIAAFISSISLSIYLLASAISQVDGRQLTIVMVILASMMTAVGGLIMVMYMATRNMREVLNANEITPVLTALSRFMLGISGAIAILSASTALLATAFNRLDSVAAMWASVASIFAALIGIGIIIGMIGQAASDPDLSAERLHEIATILTTIAGGISAVMISMAFMVTVFSAVQANAGHVVAAIASLIIMLVGVGLLIRMLSQLQFNENINRIFPALMGVFLLMGELVASVAVFTAFVSSCNVGYFMIALFAVVTLMASVVAILYQLRQMPTIDIGVIGSLVAIFGGLAIMFAAIAGFTFLLKNDPLNTIAAVLLVIGGTFIILRTVQELINSFTNLNPDALNGLTHFILSIGALLGTVGLMIAGLSIAFSNMDKFSVFLGLGATILALVIVLGSVRQLVESLDGLDVDNLNSLAYVMLSIAAILGTVTAAVVLISSFSDWKTALSVMGGLTLVLLALGGLLVIMSNIADEDVNGIALSIMAMSTSLLVLTSALYLIQNNVDPTRLKETVGALAALAGIMVLLSGAVFGLAQAGQYTLIGMAALITIAISCMGMVYALKMLDSVPFESLGERLKEFGKTLFSVETAATTWQMIGAFAAFVAIATLGGPGLLSTAAVLASIALTIGSISTGISLLAISMSTFVATISNIELSLTKFILPMMALVALLPFLSINAIALSTSFLVVSAACVLLAVSGVIVASVLDTLAEGLTKMAVLVANNWKSFLIFSGVIFVLGIALIPLSATLPLVAAGIVLLGLAFAIAMMPIIAMLTALSNFATEIGTVVDTIIAKIAQLSTEISKAIVTVVQTVGENTEGIKVAIDLLWSFAGAFTLLAFASIEFGFGLVVVALGIGLLSAALLALDAVIKRIDVEGLLALFDSVWSRGGAIAATGAALIAIGAGCIVAGIGLLFAAGGLMAFSAAVDYIMNNTWYSLETFMDSILAMNSDFALVGLGLSLIPLTVGLALLSGALPLVAGGLLLVSGALNTLPTEAWWFLDTLCGECKLAGNLALLGVSLVALTAALALIPIFATPAILGMAALVQMALMLSAMVMVSEKIADGISYIITTIFDAVYYAGSIIEAVGGQIANINIIIANSLIVVSDTLIIFTQSIYDSTIIVVSAIDNFKMEMLSVAESAPSMLSGLMLLVGGLIALGATALLVSPVSLILDALLASMSVFAPGLEAFGETISNVIVNIATSLETSATKISNAVTSIKDSLSQVTGSVSSSTVGGLMSEGTSAISDFVSGLVSDPAGAVKNVYNEGIALAQSLIGGFRSKKGIDSHSPSEQAKNAFLDFVAGLATDLKAGKKVTNALGENLGSSLTGGFKDWVSSTKIGGWITNLFSSGDGGNIISKFKDGLSAIWSGDSSILDALGLSDLMGGFDEVLNGGTDAFDSIGSSATATKGTIESLTETIKNQLKIFEKFDDSTDITASELIENMESQINGITNWAEGIETLGARGMSAALIQYLSEMGPQGYKYVEAFLDMTEEEFEHANDLYAESLTLPSDAANTIARGYEWAGAEIVASIAGGISGGKSKVDDSLGEIDETINDNLEEEASEVYNNTETAVDNTLINAINSSLETTTDSAQQAVLRNVQQALINGWTPDPAELTQAWTICYGEATRNFMASVKSGAGDESFNQLLMGNFSTESIGTWDDAWHNNSTLVQDQLEQALANRNFTADFKTAKWDANSLTQMQKLGQTSAQFVVDGMLYDAADYANMCYEAGTMYAAQIIAGYRTMLDINSPSRVMEKLMGYTISPIETTLEDTKSIFEMSEGYGEAVVDGLSKTISNIGGIFGEDLDTQPTIRPVLDLSNIEANSAQLDSYFSNKAAILGAISFNNMKSTSDPIYDMVKSLNDLNAKSNQDIIDAINRSDRPVTVNISLEGDAEGVFKLVEDQNLKATKASGVSPLMTMLNTGLRTGKYSTN